MTRPGKVLWSVLPDRSGVGWETESEGREQNPAFRDTEMHTRPRSGAHLETVDPPPRCSHPDRTTNERHPGGW